MLMNYFAILVFIIICLAGGAAIITIAYLLGKKPNTPVKIAPYECGVAISSDARMPFKVRYYFTAILFIIFDVEMVLLFPWAMAIKRLGWPGIVTMGLFLGLVGLGFVYEWKKGALEWD